MGERDEASQRSHPYGVHGRQRRIHIYEWINDVPLNDNKKTLMVNYFEYWIRKETKRPTTTAG